MTTISLDDAARERVRRRQELRRSAAAARFNGGRAKRRAAVRSYRNQRAIAESRQS